MDAVYTPASAITLFAYPRRDGQAELTWVADCILGTVHPSLMVTHPSQLSLAIPPWVGKKSNS